MVRPKYAARRAHLSAANIREHRGERWRELRLEPPYPARPKGCLCTFSYTGLGTPSTVLKPVQAGLLFL